MGNHLHQSIAPAVASSANTIIKAVAHHGIPVYVGTSETLHES